MKRKYLTENEVEQLLTTALKESHSNRDYCMIMMTFVHGLRVSELISLRTEDYDPLSQRINIRRLKGGLSTIHPLLQDENMVLQRWINERKKWTGHEKKWLFLSRKGGKLSRQRIYNMIKNYGIKSNLPLPVHPHMLRHACGYNLADRGNDTRLIQDYLGHRNIRHTVGYTAANSARFINAWNRNPEHQTLFQQVKQP